MQRSRFLKSRSEIGLALDKRPKAKYYQATGATILLTNKQTVEVIAVCPSLKKIKIAGGNNRFRVINLNDVHPDSLGAVNDLMEFFSTVH